MVEDAALRPLWCLPTHAQIHLVEVVGRRVDPLHLRHGGIAEGIGLHVGHVQVCLELVQDALLHSLVELRPRVLPPLGLPQRLVIGGCLLDHLADGVEVDARLTCRLFLDGVKQVVRVLAQDSCCL